MDKNRPITVMGIVNVTDDSYFAQSRCLRPDGEPDLELILARVERLVSEGAGIIDLGACSTRPGSVPVGADEEWHRLRPVLSVLKAAFPGLPISVDTYHAAVVAKVYDLWGDFIVNDISAGEDDPSMLRTVGERGLTYIAMHKRGTPETMQKLCDYKDVTSEVVKYFEEFCDRARLAGVKNWILDPGFGFAKTLEQNYELLSHLDAFLTFGRDILVGVSRKSMIYKKFNITPEESLPQTQVLHLAALQRGADILRVHDVAEAIRTVAVYHSL